MFFPAKIKVCVGLVILAFSANAKTSINELTRVDIESALDDARLSQGVYDDDATVPDGYKPSSSFLESSQVEKGFTLADGRVVFRFTQNAGPANALYVYNPANGMIIPYDGDPLRTVTELWPDVIGETVAPDFAAQVLEKDGVITVAFRGSDTLSDWKENGEQFMGSVTPQFQLADSLVQSIQETTDQHIHLTGHSEGGGETQYAILSSMERGNANISGMTFNSQRLSEEVMNGFSVDARDGASRVIQNYRMGNDVVSGWSFLGEDLVGDTVDLGEACFWGDNFCFRPIEAHGIDTIRERLEQLLNNDDGTLSDSSVRSENEGDENAGRTPSWFEKNDDSNGGMVCKPGDDPFDSEPETPPDDGNGQMCPVPNNGNDGSGKQPVRRRRGSGGDTSARIW